MSLDDILDQLRKYILESDHYTIENRIVDEIHPGADGIYKVNMITITTSKKVKE